MRSRLYIIFAQYRIFWKTKAWLNQVLFWLRARIFKIKRTINEEKSNVKSQINLLSIAKGQIFWALITLLLLHTIDPYLSLFYIWLDWGLLDNDETYITLLATISGVSGVFIGLYYTALSLVAGAIYSRVPNNVRDLLSHERYGNIYLRYLAFLTVLCLFLISHRLLGYPRLVIVMPVIAVAAGIAIVSFVNLGRRAFNFFDPTRLSNHIFQQLVNSVTKVKAGGFRWNDKSFQEHEHRQASRNLGTLATLADISSSEKHLSGEPFVMLTKSCITFLAYYEPMKRQIPFDSNWYKEQYAHQDWYRTGDTSISLAHQTGTMIQPKVTHDQKWLEKRVWQIVMTCIKVNFENENYDNVISILQYIDNYLQILSTEGDVVQAVQMIEEISKSIIVALETKRETYEVGREILELIAIIEMVAALPISAAIAYRKKIEHSSKDELFSQLKRLKWKKPDSQYKGQFNSYCLSTLEWLQDRLSFEKQVDGCYETPIWYQIELIMKDEAKRHVENVTALVRTISNMYQEWRKSTDELKRPWLTAAILTREWEYWHKIESFFSIAEEKWEELSNERRIEGLPWPVFDGDALKHSLLDRKNDVPKKMSEYQILLAMLDRPDGYPDYRGQFLHTSGEAILESLCNNKINLAKVLYKPFFYGCFMKFDELRPSTVTEEWLTVQQFKIAVAPIIDLIELSGYAKLMSDYHGNVELWKYVVDTWNEYFDQKNTSIKAISALLSHYRGIGELPHREVLRTGWWQKIWGMLKQVPSKEEYRRSIFSPEIIVEHDSPLVRVLAAKRFSSQYRGKDIFAVYYLLEREDANRLSFTRWTESLKRSLADEEAEETSPEDDNGDI